MTELSTQGKRDANFYLEKIRKYKFECGCKLGAIFFSIAALSFIVFEGYIRIMKHSPGINYTKINLYGALIVFCSAMLGKLVGIGLAKIKLRIAHEKYNRLIKT